MLDSLKGSLKSLTILTNVLALSGVPALDYAQTQLPQLQAVLPENLYNYAFMGIVLANVVLRFRTTKALADK